MTLKRLYVNGAGAEANIVNKFPDSGENWFKVSEHTPDDDDTYLYSNSDDYQRDLYTIQDSIWGGTINKVGVMAAIKVDAYQFGDRSFKMALRTHGTIYDGPEGFRITTGVYSHYNYRDWFTNPYTGEAWTWAEINTLQVGISIKRQLVSLGEIRVTQVHCRLDITSFTPTVADAGYIWTGGNKLRFIPETQLDYVAREQQILGADTTTDATAGHLFVEGNYLHFISQNGDERRQMGKLTNRWGYVAGHIWIDDMWLYYIDSSGYERKLGTWMLGQSHLGVDTILHT